MNPETEANYSSHPTPIFSASTAFEQSSLDNDYAEKDCSAVLHVDGPGITDSQNRRNGCEMN